MANIKISELDELVNVANDDYLPIVDTSKGETKKVKILRIGTGGKSGDTLPIGSMIPYGDNTAPANWLVCDGSAVSRTTYADLFAVIGTSYGEGDGSTTFNLPNKKGKVSVGLDTEDTDFNEIGKTGGEKTHKLTIAEMPSHEHLFKFTYEIDAPAQHYGTGQIYFGTERNYNAGNNSNHTESDGGDAPHNNLQPYEVDCWIIKAFQSAGVVANVTSVKTVSDVDVYDCNYINTLEQKIIDVYSTDEVKTNKVWIENGVEKPVYRKVFVIDTLPNATVMPIETNLNNIKVIKIYGEANDSNGSSLPLPYIGVFIPNSSIEIAWLAASSQIRIATQNDRSSYGAYIVLEYLKTT